MSKIWPFVLCGGAGTRLWPLSRDAYPSSSTDWSDLTHYSNKPADVSAAIFSHKYRSSVTVSIAFSWRINFTRLELKPQRMCLNQSVGTRHQQHVFPRSLRIDQTLRR